jgi:branched-chain amino acid transport system ATP-binding protein
MYRLAITNLCAGYGDFQALFGIDLQVAPGEVVALIGANGAGKSTLLNAIAGEVPAAREAIRLDGKALGGLATTAIVALGIALVPEGRRLFRSLTVEENLLVGGSAGRAGRWTLAKIYDLFPVLRERRTQAATSMSGGEQQMVAIGRALMSNPAVLLCDELSLGLSPKAVGDIYAALGEIRGDTTMVIVEQDIPRALQFADRAVCLQEGRVTLSGVPSVLSHAQIQRAYFGEAVKP